MQLYSIIDHLESSFGTAILSELIGQHLTRNGQPVRLFDETKHTAERFYRNDGKGKPYIHNFQLGGRYYPVTAYVQAYQVDISTAIKDLCQQYNVESDTSFIGRLIHQQRSRPPVTPAKFVPPFSVINEEVVDASLNRYEHNNLVQYLVQRLGESKAHELVTLYQVGTSNHWEKQGATVFWQRDEQGRVRGGKIMLYNPVTGKRCREKGYEPTWAHSLLRLPGFALSQCLFGLHQLPSRPNDKVAIVESEKTAMIASALCPHYIWLATGGKDGLKIEHFRALAGRKVVLYPDLSVDGSVYFKWQQTAKEIATSLGLQVSVSTYMEDRATDEQRMERLDIADVLIELQPSGVESEPAVSDQPPSIMPVLEEDLPDWYTAFNLPWRWDATATLARVLWMVLLPGVIEGSANDIARKPNKFTT